MSPDSAAAETAGPEAIRARRRRRTQADVVERIRDAAGLLFAERGYAATTTREIARLADVSETLLFRHFGDKASLFDKVVTVPFQRLMDDFVRRHPDAAASSERIRDIRSFTRRVYELFEGNEATFRALLSGPGGMASDGDAPGLHGLDHFFDQAAGQVQLRYAEAAIEPPFDLDVGVRLGMGMIAASVLLRRSLFPSGDPDREAVIGVLETMVERTLSGPPSD